MLLGTLTTRTILLTSALGASVLIMAFFDPRRVDLIAPTVFVLIGVLLGAVARCVWRDLIRLRSQLALWTMARLAGLATIYLVPFLFLLWLFGDLTDTYGRAFQHGCSAALQNEGGLYGLPAGNDGEGTPELYGNKVDDAYFLVARVAVSEPHTERSYMQSFLADPLTSFFCPPSMVPVDHEASALATVDSYIDRISETLERRTNETLEAGLQEGAETATSVLQTVFGLSDLWDTDRLTRRTRDPETNELDCGGILPSTLNCYSDLPRCSGWFRTALKCLQRRILSPVYGGYEMRRNVFEATRRADTALFNEGAENFSDSVRRIVSAFVTTELVVIERMAKTNISTAFKANGAWTWIGYAIIFIAILKVYFYCFARLLIASAPKGGNAYLTRGVVTNGYTLTHVDARPLDPHGNKSFEVPVGTQKWFAFSHHNIHWHNPQRRDWIFRPTESLLRRIAAGKYAPTVYEQTGVKGDGIPLLALGGDNFDQVRPVLIRLSKGDRIIVSTQSVAAITEGLHFRTVFQPDLAGFLLGQWFFTAIEGDGSCILAGNGASVIEPLEKPERFVQPNRILGMHANGLYRFSGQSDFNSVYIEPFSLRPKDNGLLIASDAKQGSFQGLRVLVRGFLFAFLPI